VVLGFCNVRFVLRLPVDRSAPDEVDLSSLSRELGLVCSLQSVRQAYFRMTMMQVTTTQDATGSERAVVQRAAHNQLSKLIFSVTALPI